MFPHCGIATEVKDLNTSATAKEMQIKKTNIKERLLFLETAEMQTLLKEINP